MEAAFRAAEAHGIRAILGKVMMDRVTYDPTIEPATILDRTPARGGRPHRSLARRGRRAARLRGDAAVRGLVHGRDAARVRVAGALDGDLVADATCRRTRARSPRSPGSFRRRATTSTSTTERAGSASGRSWPTRSTCPIGSSRGSSRRGTRVSHCPASNLFIGAGVMPLARWLEAGVVVGLGSDVSGGPDPSLFSVMRAGAYAQMARRSLAGEEPAAARSARVAPARDARRGAGAGARRSDRVDRGRARRPT